MQHLALCNYDTAALATLDAAQLEAIGPACRPQDATLRAPGRLATQGSFTRPATWKSIRPTIGRSSVSDRAYLPGPNRAGAVLLIDAHTPEEALAVAPTHAAANFAEQLGLPVELRACGSFESFKS